MKITPKETISAEWRKDDVCMQYVKSQTRIVVGRGIKSTRCCSIATSEDMQLATISPRHEMFP